MNKSVDPLVSDLAAGQLEAFGQLYDQYAGRLFAAALRMLRRRECAEDVVQEVFVAMVRSRHRLSDVEDLTAYLFATLRHAVAQHAPRRTRLPIVNEPAEDLAVTFPDQPDSRRDELRDAIANLPSAQRDVIALKIDGELTFAQIGQAIGVSTNTAASRYRYALEKLRANFQASSKGETD